MVFLVSSIYLGISLNFSNAYLKDVLNEITDQAKVNIIYPSSIESLKVSINLSKAEIDTALKLLLLPLNLDFEKVAENIYVIYSLENTGKDKYVGEYTIKYTNPKYLIELIESIGYNAYSYNGRIYFYTPTKNSYERVIKILENMDLPKPEDTLLLSVKYYSKADISSTLELTNGNIVMIDSVSVFENVRSKKEMFTLINLGELSQENKKILSLDDLLEIEKIQTESSNYFVLKTKESTVNIDISQLLGSGKNGKPNNYVVKLGNDVFLASFQILKGFNEVSHQGVLKVSSDQKIQKREKTLFGVIFNPADATLQIGTERVSSAISFRNSDFTLTNIELCVFLFDNVSAYLDYNFSEKELGFSLSDKVSTDFVHLYSKFRYSITKNEFSLSTQMGLRLKIQSLELVPLFLADSKDGLFYGILTGLHQANFSGEIWVILNSQLRITWGLKLIW